MSYRGGRGRGAWRGGRGGGGGARGFVFKFFPECRGANELEDHSKDDQSKDPGKNETAIVALPNAKYVKEEVDLVKWAAKLQKFWNSSPYYSEGVGEDAKKSESTTLKSFTNKSLEKTMRKIPLSEFMKMTHEYVPAELCGKKVQRSRKKARWNLDSDRFNSDLFEKLEAIEKKQPEDETSDKESKDGDEDDDEVIGDDEGQMSSSDRDDYDQNDDKDDDDLDQESDHDDEPSYD